MKSLFYILAIGCLFCALGCESDPCKDVFCNQFSANVQNTCVDGACRCEIDDIGVLDIFIKCSNCTPNNKLSVDLLLDGNKVGSLIDIFGTTAIRLQYKDYPSGTKAYKVVTGTKVHESGNIKIEKCKVLAITANATK